MSETTTLDSVCAAVMEATGTENRPGAIGADTALMGGMPEFDSLALVQLLTVLEERFGVEVDPADVTPEVFATVRTLTDYVQGRVQGG